MSRMLGKFQSGHWFTIVALSVLATSVAPRSGRAEISPHSVLQAVNNLGTPLSPPTGRLQLQGVVINNPWDLLDYDNSTSASSGPQWQVFIQAVDPSDFGGTALYMRKMLPPYPAPDPDLSYSDEEWTSEMERLNFPRGPGQPSLRRGDLIQVDARAPGLFYGGKFNINEQHSKDALFDFDITILERDLTPQATLIDLSHLKDSNDKFIFDVTRLTGGEHYQGSLVHLDNLTIVDPANWALNSLVTVRQGDYTMPLLLGLDPGLLSIVPSAETKFSLTAILDQEAGSKPKEGYRLWLTSAGDFSAVPEPSALVLAVISGLLMYPVVRKHRLRRS